MKKILLLLAVVFFAACSTDDTVTNETGSEYKSSVLIAISGCDLGINGSVYIDVANGIQNPVAVFTADVEGGAAKINYRTSVEIELLSDCEDIESGNGTVSSYSTATIITNPSVNSPIVRINKSLLPAQPCYRWRFIIEGSQAKVGNATCVSYSEWYDAPLF